MTTAELIKKAREEIKAALKCSSNEAISAARLGKSLAYQDFAEEQATPEAKEEKGPLIATGEERARTLELFVLGPDGNYEKINAVLFPEREARK